MSQWTTLDRLREEHGYAAARFVRHWREGEPLAGGIVESTMIDGERMWRVVPAGQPSAEDEPSQDAQAEPQELALDEAPIHGRTLGALHDAGLLYSGDVVRHMGPVADLDTAVSLLTKLRGVGKKGAGELVDWLLEHGLEFAGPVEVEGEEVLDGTFCKTCGEPIAWLTSENGKPFPIDAVPVPDGNVLALAGVAHVIKKSEVPSSDSPRYVSHWVTCGKPPEKTSEITITGQGEVTEEVSELVPQESPDGDPPPSSEPASEPASVVPPTAEVTVVTHPPEGAGGRSTDAGAVKVDTSTSAVTDSSRGPGDTGHSGVLTFADLDVGDEFEFERSGEVRGFRKVELFHRDNALTRPRNCIDLDTEEPAYFRDECVISYERCVLDVPDGVGTNAELVDHCIDIAGHIEVVWTPDRDVEHFKRGMTVNVATRLHDGSWTWARDVDALPRDLDFEMRPCATCGQHHGSDVECDAPEPKPPAEKKRDRDRAMRPCNCVEPGVPDDAYGWTRCTNRCGGYVWVDGEAESAALEQARRDADELGARFDDDAVLCSWCGAVHRGGPEACDTPAAVVAQKPQRNATDSELVHAEHNLSPASTEPPAEAPQEAATEAQKDAPADSVSGASSANGLARSDAPDPGSSGVELLWPDEDPDLVWPDEVSADAPAPSSAAYAADVNPGGASAEPYRLLGHAESDSEAWHALRARGIGSSDAGAIIGVSPHATPVDVWRSKIGEPQRARPWLDVYSAFGTWFEPFLREHCEVISGVSIESGDELGTLQSTIWPVACANLDGRDQFGIVEELKTTSEKWTVIPEAYIAQVQHQMFVCGAPEARIRQYVCPIDRELAMGLLAHLREQLALPDRALAEWLLTAGEVITWIVERDENYIDRLIARERKFWTHVENKTEPPVLDPDGTADLTDDTEVYAAVYEYARHAQEIDAYKPLKKEADGAKKEARRAIERAIALLEDAPKRVVVGEHKATLVVRDTHSYWNIYHDGEADDGVIF